MDKQQPIPELTAENILASLGEDTSKEKPASTKPSARRPRRPIPDEEKKLAAPDSRFSMPPSTARRFIKAWVGYMSKNDEFISKSRFLEKLLDSWEGS